MSTRSGEGRINLYPFEVVTSTLYPNRQPLISLGMTAVEESDNYMYLEPRIPAAGNYLVAEEARLINQDPLLTLLNPKDIRRIAHKPPASRWNPAEVIPALSMPMEDVSKLTMPRGARPEDQPEGQPAVSDPELRGALVSAIHVEHIDSYSGGLSEENIILDEPGLPYESDYYLRLTSFGIRATVRAGVSVIYVPEGNSFTLRSNPDHNEGQAAGYQLTYKWVEPYGGFEIKPIGDREPRQEGFSIGALEADAELDELSDGAEAVSPHSP